MAEFTRIKLEPLPFDEAIAYWRRKVVLPPREYARLADQVKGNAFTIARIASLDMLHEVWKLLDVAIAEGKTIREFQEQVKEIFATKGWEGPTPYRLDNIFRTNIQTAFSVGRYKQMTDPDVIQARPYWMYDAVNDSRTRPSHLALDGLVFRADDPFWDTWYPPNGYRCRCSVRSLSERDTKREGLTVQTGEYPTVSPDPGFRHNPGKEAWKPDLDKYPGPLRKAFLDRMGATP